MQPWAGSFSIYANSCSGATGATCGPGQEAWSGPQAQAPFGSRPLDPVLDSAQAIPQQSAEEKSLGIICEHILISVAARKVRNNC